MIKKLLPSQLVVAGILLITCIYLLKNKQWQSLSIIQYDVTSYYSYLPAAIIYQDLTFSFVDNLPKDIRDKIFNVKYEGKITQKMTLGVALLLLPFFLSAHGYSVINSLPLTGYTAVYEFSIALASLFYFAIGLIYLRKSLIKFFNDPVTSITLVLISLATNLFYYTIYEPGMPHVYSFSLFSVFLYVTIKWHQKTSTINSILLGLILGLITLVRPTDVVAFIVLILFAVFDKKSFVNKVQIVRNRWVNVLIIGCFVLVALSPQFAYWKYVTGKYIYYSYNDETFYFKNPYILEGLFGFRKGFFIYSPAMIFLLPGLFLAIKHKKSFGFAVTFFFILNVYIIFSWWCWWYGGSFGSRPIVNSLAILSLPIGAFIEKCLKYGRVVKILVLTSIIFFIKLNFFQSDQYKKGLLHYEGMNAKLYFSIFGKNHFPPYYSINLSYPDMENAKKGMPERDMFKPALTNLTFLYKYKIAIKGNNGKFFCAEINDHDLINCNREKPNEWETFFISKFLGNICTIQSFQGKYLGVDLNNNSKLFAYKTYCEPTEIFRIVDLENNKFALKAFNGCYVSLKKYSPFYLISNAEGVGPYETFTLVSE